MRKVALFLLAVTLIALPAAAQLATPKSSAPEIIIPAAGAVQGVGGTFFRSDITIINYRATDQRVRLYWLPQNTPGTNEPPVDITIPASSGIVSEDFVTSIMRKSGLGAILVRAIRDDDTFDINGRLYATARIWTPQPGSNGTVSQSFPTLSTTDIPNALRVAIIGQRRDDRYRLNIGIVNLDPTVTQTFTVTVSIGGGSQQLQTVSVPPMSVDQVALIGPASPTVQVTVLNTTGGIHSPFVAYGSSVDNDTGDGWSTVAFAPVGQ